MMSGIEMNKGMLLEFNNILEYGHVTTLYQPIVDLKNGSVMGYEALSRGPEHSNLHSPLSLLSIAELLNQTWELEQLLRVKALERATFTDEALLFINVDPNVIRDPEFKKGFTKENLEKLDIAPSSIVLEITERSAIDSYEDFKIILDHYKEQGYHIAIDDFGSGYSGLKTLYEVYPRFSKIDMDFIRHIDKDKFKQAIVRSFIEMASLANMKTIAEGIETKEELKALIALGVDYGQGYYIKRPQQEVSPICNSVLNLIERENKLVTQISNYSQEYHYIHHIMKEVEAFNKSEKCKRVSERLNELSNTSIAVVEDGVPIGIITRHEINRVFATQYGFSVYSHRPVELVMDKYPMIVDYFTPIYDVAKLALSREQDHLYDDIIVTQGDTYVGVITMKDLLEYAINYEKNHAKELNPLTGLPGNTIINRVMKQSVESDRPSTIIYVDLDNFKVYNDIYGFEKGDQVLKMTAEILKKTVDMYMPQTTFLGHIGGDDFIIVMESNQDMVQDFCTSVVQSFDVGMRQHLDIEHLESGKMIALGRDGKEKDFDLTSISLAGLIGPLFNFEDVEALSSKLAVLKKETKKIKKSNYTLTQMM